MDKFINFTTERGLSINTYRAPDALGGDIVDLVDAVIKGTGSIYCPLDGAAGALLDGSLWHEVAKCYCEKDTTVALDLVHNAIIEHTLKEEGII